MGNLRDGLIAFVGLLCFLAFSLNAGVLIWLLFKRSQRELIRCPKCGRMIACPHCADDDTHN